MTWAAKIALLLGLMACALNAQPRRRPLPQGPELVQRLAAMSPEEREKALSALPAPRRANLEQRIRDFQTLPPAQQRLMRQRAEKINSLPPERQVEVRASLRDFNQLPQERKLSIRREIRRTTGMPDDSREAYFNSEGFRTRFSSTERRMIDDLREIAPDDPPLPPNRPR